MLSTDILIDPYGDSLNIDNLFLYEDTLQTAYEESGFIIENLDRLFNTLYKLNNSENVSTEGLGSFLKNIFDHIIEFIKSVFRFIKNVAVFIFKQIGKVLSFLYRLTTSSDEKKYDKSVKEYEKSVKEYEKPSSSELDNSNQIYDKIFNKDSMSKAYSIFIDGIQKGSFSNVNTYFYEIPDDKKVILDKAYSIFDINSEVSLVNPKKLMTTNLNNDFSRFSWVKSDKLPSETTPYKVTVGTYFLALSTVLFKASRDIFSYVEQYKNEKIKKDQNGNDPTVIFDRYKKMVSELDTEIKYCKPVVSQLLYRSVFVAGYGDSRIPNFEFWQFPVDVGVVMGLLISQNDIYQNPVNFVDMLNRVKRLYPEYFVDIDVDNINDVLVRFPTVITNLRDAHAKKLKEMIDISSEYIASAYHSSYTKLQQKYKPVECLETIKNKNPNLMTKDEINKVFCALKVINTITQDYVDIQKAYLKYITMLNLKINFCRIVVGDILSYGIDVLTSSIDKLTLGPKEKEVLDKLNNVKLSLQRILMFKNSNQSNTFGRVKIQTNFPSLP